jgi:hypothetical protein
MDRLLVIRVESGTRWWVGRRQPQTVVATVALRVNRDRPSTHQPTHQQLTQSAATMPPTPTVKRAPTVTHRCAAI